MSLSQADTDMLLDASLKAGSMLIDAIGGGIKAAAEGDASALAGLDPAHAAAVIAYREMLGQVAAARATTDEAIEQLRKKQEAVAAKPVIESTGQRDDSPTVKT